MKILFLDLETTGFDPDRDLILEVGAILYDIVEERETWRSLFVVAPPEARHAPMDKVVREMHTKSGLFDTLIATAGVDHDDLIDTEHAILYALELDGLGPQACIMGGFTPSFDRSFLRAKMPWLERYLHHRLLDISTLRTLEKAWNGENPAKVEKHRALPDCEEAIAELLRFKRKWPGILAPLVTPMLVQP